ncbi:MAG: DoxX family protein [Jatrophihabitans sp.]
MNAHRAMSGRLPVTAAAWALAALLLTTGTWHFASPKGFRSIVPGFLGSPTFWVAVSGVAELGCALLLLLPPTRRLAGWACAVLFVAVFPANIAMALHTLGGDGNALIAWVRLPLQIPLIMWAVYIARRADHGSTAPGRPASVSD